MNQTKVNQIISYIKAQDEFPFDVFDVEDQESVLGYLVSTQNWMTKNGKSCRSS